MTLTAYVVKDVPSETYPRFGSASLKLIISTVSSTTTLFGEKVALGSIRPYLVAARKW